MAEYQISKARHLTFDNLIQKITEQSKEGKRFCFILGAGASVESGIPSGQTMERIWMDYIMSHDTEGFRNRAAGLYAEKRKKKERIKTPFDKMEAAWQEAKKTGAPIPSSYYFDIYKLRFFDERQNGYLYLEETMDSKTPSLGYYYLTRLMAKGQHNVIITTNFDNLAEDALFLHYGNRALVAGHEAVAARIHPDVNRPMVAKLHRDVMYEPFNTMDETAALKDQWVGCLHALFSDYIPVVVGYEGGDRSLMAFLQKQANLRHGIYWCYWGPGGNLPSGDIQRFLDDKDGFLFPIPGFDGLMMELYHSMFPEENAVIPSATEQHMEDQYNARFGTYQDYWDDFMKNQNYADTITRLQIKELEVASRSEREKTKKQTYWDYVRQGDQLDKENRLEEALAEYEKAIQADSHNSAAYNNRGITYAKMNKYQESLADFDQAIRLSPNSPAAYCNRGNTYNLMGEFQQAIDDYTMAIHLADPNDPRVYVNRGNAYDNLGKFQEAMDDFNRAIQLAPNNPAAYYNRGVAFKDSCQFQRAIDDFTQVIHLEPNHTSAYINRSACYFAVNDLCAAMDDCNQAIKLSPNEAIAYINRGGGYSCTGKFQEALADYSRAIHLNPNIPETYHNRGNTYREMGKFREALTDFDKAIQLNPNLPEPYFNRGVIYISMGKFRKALDDYNRAIQLNPNYPKAYNGRGIAYDNLGRFQEAMADFDRAIQLNPNFSDAYTGYGVVCANTCRFQDAIDNFTTAINMPPPHSLKPANLKITLRNRARAYRALGEEEKAQADEARADSL